MSSRFPLVYLNIKECLVLVFRFLETMKKYSIIAACCRSNGIGKSNTLPWRLKSEMEYFTRITSTVRHYPKDTGDVELKKNAVIMGTRTYLSIPPRFRPLRNRVNVVLSRSLTELPAGCSHLFSNLDDAISVLSTLPEIDRIFVIGGEQLYQQAMSRPENVEFVYLTRLDADFDCDRFFPTIDSNVFEDITQTDHKEKKNILYEENIPTEEQEENGLRYRYHLYQPILQH